MSTVRALATPARAGRNPEAEERRSEDRARLRILVCSEETLAGRAMASLLSRSGSIDAQYGGTLHDSSSKTISAQAHAVLWFGEVADEDTIECVRGIRDARPGLAVCLLVERLDFGALRDLLARDAGGVGVMLRSARPDLPDVVRMVLQAMAGTATLTPCLVEELASEPRLRPEPFDALSKVERDVLAMLALGCRNGEIAKRMSRSEKFVERHVARIFKKLDLNDEPHRVMDRRVLAARLFLLRAGSARLS